MTSPLPLAVTMGEPAGIGGELSLKAWLAKRHAVTRPFFLLDDPGRLEALARGLKLDVPIRAIGQPSEAATVFSTALPVLPVSLAIAAKAGHPSAANAPATIASIERAVALAQSGEAAGIVTNPIQKKTLQDAGFRHPGHTEFLAKLAGVEVAMMLACPELRVVPVTIHLALADAVRALDVAGIVRAGRIAAMGLKSLFGITRPRLAVAGLNPHAGEQGTMGDEEIRLIAPAIEILRRDGVEVHGPASADTLFHPAARATYDAALCMYHDQALIPIKTIDFWGGVNITLGLPFVRTSPDHGTALDIAGTGRADAASLLAALDMADDLARRRKT